MWDPGEVPFVFRPQTGIAVCVLWTVLSIVWLASEAQSGWLVALTRLPLIAFFSTITYALFGRTRVVVRDDGVLLRNVVRDVDVPYAALARVDTQYALTLTTVDGHRHQAWAAPSSGRIGAARVTDEERKALSWSGPVDEIPASAGLRSDAGAVAVVIRRKWQPADPAGSATRIQAAVEIRWATGVLTILTLCTAAVMLVALF